MPQKSEHHCFFCRSSKDVDGTRRYARTDRVPIQPGTPLTDAWLDIKDIIGMCWECFQGRRAGYQCDIPPVEAIKKVFYDCGAWQRKQLIGDIPLGYLEPYQQKKDGQYGAYTKSLEEMKERIREYNKTGIWQIRKAQSGHLIFVKGNIRVSGVGIKIPKRPAAVSMKKKTLEEWEADPRTVTKGNPATGEEPLTFEELVDIFEQASAEDRKKRDKAKRARGSGSQPE